VIRRTNTNLAERPILAEVAQGLGRLAEGIDPLLVSSRSRAERREILEPAGSGMPGDDDYDRCLFALEHLAERDE